MYDLKIFNGKIMDLDTGIEKICDIGIVDGIIKNIGNCPESGKIEIDALTNLVSPGFIDIHIHEECVDSMKKLNNNYYTTSKMVLEGVTTVVGGNCGNNRQGIEVFNSHVNKYGAPVNYLNFIGNRFLRALAGNIDDYAKSSKNQINYMAQEANRYLENEAIGVSFGLEYSPGADFDEIMDFLNLIEKRDILLSAHYRKDSKYGVDSIKELINISKSSSLPMQISHIGSCTAFGMMEESLQLIDNAIKDGVDIIADCYPYDAFCTRIGTAVYDKGCFELWNKTYNDIMLIEEPYTGVRCDQEIFEKVRKEYPDMMTIAYVMNEEEIIKALQAPFVMVASDGLFRNDQGHPRGSGTFPRVLGKYTRELKKLSLLEAIRKMTVMPAKRLGLSRKGAIKEGYDADLVIFNPDTIIDRATFSEPTLTPDGIKYVIINGKIAVKDNILVNSNLGKCISRKELNKNY